jgi:polyisoprenoid-binding protein YceI
MILSILNKFRHTLAGLVLVGMLVPASASSNADVCSPFQGGKVDSAVVQHMLDAASKGQLYQIQSDTSRIGFCIDSPIGLIEGDFKQFQGGFTMEQQAGNNQGKALFRIETGSVDVSNSFVRNMLEGESFLDSEHFPEMLFVSKGFYWVNENEAVLVGDLTIRDVTRTVGFHVEMIEQESEIGQDGQLVQVKASTRISRAAFGIISMSSVVSDDISLCMQVEAVRYSA